MTIVCVVGWLPRVTSANGTNPRDATADDRRGRRQDKTTRTRRAERQARRAGGAAHSERRMSRIRRFFSIGPPLHRMMFCVMLLFAVSSSRLPIMICAAAAAPSQPGCP